MELRVRLVNGRDVRTHYTYPAVVPKHPVNVHRNAALPVSAAQLTRVDEFSYFVLHRSPKPSAHRERSVDQDRNAMQKTFPQSGCNLCTVVAV
ncbi:hypothetical protein VZT92_022363 [Zoarces viviparus]|uniref:Uncharacterized protein n=1 Tax=Zoarces viviparus TaxID=48416 RepID=A0AAW1EB45_ZOAVI